MRRTLSALALAATLLLGAATPSFAASSHTSHPNCGRYTTRTHHSSSGKTCPNPVGNLTHHDPTPPAPDACPPVGPHGMGRPCVVKLQ
jgi:hypothetical protein